MNFTRKLSVWYVVAMPVIAGLSTLDLQVGGLNYTGFIWALLLPVGLYLLALNRFSGTTSATTLPCWPWLIWSAFVCLSLLWCDDLTRRNIQDALQLCMPIVVALLAASSIRTQAELSWLYRGFGVCLVLLMLFTFAYVTERFDKEWLATNMRGAAMTAVLVGCVFLSEFPKRKVLPIAGWGFCLLVTVLTSSRMATLALLAVPAIHPLFRNRLVMQGAAVAVALCIGLLLLNTQSFQEHFFQSGKGSVRDLLSGDVKDEGRYDAWEAGWKEAWRHPVLGAGVGSIFMFVPEVWDGMNHIHNDYLRVFFEFGVVGLSLFVAVCMWQIVVLRRQIGAMPDGLARMTLAAAWLGFCAMLISCSTDNTIGYTVLYTNPLFALLGAGYGALHGEPLAACAPSQSMKPSVRLAAMHERLLKIRCAANSRPQSTR